MKDRVGQPLFALATLALAAVFAVSFSSAQQMGTEGQKAPLQNVTGCLQKGSEPGGFNIVGEDGKIWELHSKKVALADHVGHTVSVTGSPEKMSDAQEQKIESSENNEAAGKEHGDLRVAALKMVSETCNK